MSNFWYEDKEKHQQLVPLIKFLKQHQSYRHMENLRHVRMYGNLDVMGLSAIQYSRPNPTTVNNRVTLNVIKSCIDTAQSKIAKNKPKPTFLTSGGDWAKQKKAKKLDKFVLGCFYEADFYHKAQRVFVDACILGTGALKIFEKDGKIQVERTITDELVTDDGEAVYGTPQNLYQTKVVSRQLLIKMFPKKKMAIEALQSIAGYQYSVGPNFDSDQVVVYEAWHLPTSEDAHDGMHTICIDGADLFSEEWTKPYFPFAFFRWCERPFGFWGQGIAEELVGIQVEINKMLKNIQVAHHLLSAPAVFLEKGSEILTPHLSNEIGRIIKYKGVKPEVGINGSIVPPEIYQHLERLYQRAFEIVGISQLSAQAQKPAGLNSGKALREFNDIESDRFIIVGQRWEQFAIDAAKQVIGCAKEIYKKDKEYKIKIKGRKFMDTIKWEDVDLEEDQYIMQIFPTSMLPNEPAGRLETVQEMIAANMLDPETGMELLDFPDLEQTQNLRFAAREVVREIVDKMIEDGEFTAPEPFMDLSYAQQYAQTAYNKAKIDYCPEEHLELVRRFIEQCNHLMQPEQPAQPQQPPMEQSPMEGAPMEGMPMEGMPMEGQMPMEPMPQ